ncbi:MAG: hypothetical protein ACKV2T_17240 [Kofleriaceae bacterium]
MSLTVVSYDNRAARHVDMGWEINTAYCTHHGYRFETHRTYERDVPPWWVKVFLLNDYVRQAQSKDEWFLWLDSDSFLRREHLPIAALLASVPASCHFIGGNDPLGRDGNVNTGVFAVRATDVGRAIMNAWVECFEPTVWFLQDGVWSTPGPWAGPAYEQGAFNRQILGHPECREHVRILGNLFVSYDFDAAGFIKHFPVHLRPRVDAAYDLFRADHSSTLCLQFGGEYHELVRKKSSNDHVLRWPLRFPLTTCSKHGDAASDEGFWKWRHDGAAINGWVECRADGRVKSSWFGVDGWWYRRHEGESDHATNDPFPIDSVPESLDVPTRRVTDVPQYLKAP